MINYFFAISHVASPNLGVSLSIKYGGKKTFLNEIATDLSLSQNEN